MLFIKQDNALRLDLIRVEGFDNVQLINLNLNSNVLEVNIKTKKMLYLNSFQCQKCAGKLEVWN